MGLVLVPPLANGAVMIKTVQDLREALNDAPDDMPLRALYTPGFMTGVDSIKWIEGRCVIVCEMPKRKKLSISTPRNGSN